MIEVINTKLIGWSLFLQLWLPLHTQCYSSRSMGHSLCANVSNTTHFKDRRNENNYIYYAESDITKGEPLLSDMDPKHQIECIFLY